MKYSTDLPVKIIMLGAGGTGGHAAPHLYRLLYSLSRSVRFILVDGDAVEEKNLVRQNFSAYDLGRNKARTIAERYSDAFGIEPEYVPDFIEDKERLLKLVTPDVHSLPRSEWRRNNGKIVKSVSELVVLIGAVDNNKSRQLCHEVFKEASDLVYIDSGNGEFSGQVVCGVRRNSRTMYKPVGAFYPDVLEDADKFPTELSCAEAAVSSPQAITANVTAAAIIVDIIYNIVALGENDVHHVPFSARSVSIKPQQKQRRPAA